MPHFNHDGHRFDLQHTYVDVTGTEWAWTGAWTAGEFPEPLMQSTYRGQFSTDTPVSLPDLYRDRGPLITVKAPLSAADRRAALLAPAPGFVATLAAGFVESLDAYDARLARKVTS